MATVVSSSMYADTKVVIVFPMVCRDWYQSGALLASEEGVIIAGLLVGLNTIDYNVVMKGEDFDKPVRINIIVYM